MTYCKEFSALLDLYRRRAFPGGNRPGAGHLHTCDGCRAYVQAALAIRDAFPEAEDTPVPDGFAAGVMAAIRADAAPEAPETPVGKDAAPLAACCAVVVLAVSGLPRPGGTAVTDHPDPMQIAAPAEAAVPSVDSVEEDTAATAYASPTRTRQTSRIPLCLRQSRRRRIPLRPAHRTSLLPPPIPKQHLPREGSSADVPETAPATFAINPPA
ncbi:MAG: hypothetical protein ACLTYN_09705 [Dysosmobacter welbionis]